MREISHELIGNLTDVDSACIGTLASRISATIKIPIYDDAMKMAYEKNEVFISKIFDTIASSRDVFAKKRAPFSIYERDRNETTGFLHLLEWGGSELINTIKGDQYIKLNIRQNAKIQKLYESSWRMTQPLDLDELTFIASTSENAFNWNLINVDELAYVIAYERNWMIRTDLSYAVIYNHFYTKISDTIEKFRNIVDDSSAMAWVLSIINYNHQFSQGTQKLKHSQTNSYFELAEEFNLLDIKKYLDFGMIDINTLRYAIDNGIDAHLMKELHNA